MSKSRRVETLLLLAGLAGIGVWAGSAICRAIYQSWANYDFERGIHSDSPAAPEPSASQPRTGPGADRQRSVGEDGLVGRLTIPRLHLRAIVREGTGEGTLGWALGHIPGTAFPGQDGNVGVAGHRDTLFRELGAIKKDDRIDFQTLGGSYAYRVESTQVVEPHNVSVLKRSRHQELTLVTCYPFHYLGSAPDRFIVKARLVSQSPAAHENAEQGQPTADAPAVQPVGVEGGVERRPGNGRVTFQVSEKHSRELAPGISFGLSRTDVARHRLDGCMWLAPDRRTIWLRDQDARKPIVFYGYRDGKKRELVITSVTRKSVGGYLLMPGKAAQTGSYFLSR
jgi:sortase A